MSRSVEEEELQFFTNTKTSEIWKSVSSIIMTIVDEAYFEAGPEGLAFRSMDPSHIALIDLSWPKSGFEKYECPYTAKFGFKISDFAKIIKRANSGDSIDVYLKDNSLNIKTTGSYTRNYKMNLVEGQAANTSPIPNLSLDSKIAIGTYALDKILSDIQVMSNIITMETVNTKKNVIFRSSSDNGIATVDLGTDRSNTEISMLQDLTVKENSKCSYNVDYISKIVKILSSSSDTITLEYSSKKPLRLESVLLNTVKMQFFLAPRVDNNN